MERGEHKPGDLVDTWYDFPNEDTPGWRGPAQIVTANDGEDNVTALFQCLNAKSRPFGGAGARFLFCAFVIVSHSQRAPTEHYPK